MRSKPLPWLPQTYRDNADTTLGVLRNSSDGTYHHRNTIQVASGDERITVQVNGCPGGIRPMRMVVGKCVLYHKPHAEPPEQNDKEFR